MARDITIRVTGQNPDGTLNVQQLDGANPFMQQSSGAMTPYTPAAAATTAANAGYRAKINGVDVTFASEADYLKADRALRDMAQSNNIPNVGGGGGGTSGTGLGWLRTGANAADAVAGFLNGRNIRRKLGDLDDSLNESRLGLQQLDEIERSNSTLAPLVPTLRRLFLAERDATETSLTILEDQLTAVDIQTGAGVARVAADLIQPSNGGGILGNGNGSGSGLGTTLAVGGAGLGVGLLLSSRDDDRRRRSR